ncbi:hypothetical protein [Fibrobacter sp. UBA4309]|uniref:hypothetical protein n=1 Tax=Fibrobacter sp. UBA4309 TaxID=1946537 RepID=UPI0025BDCAE7|nr:hypothetical protein [Fibrobacter sp. UBA4309]
MQNKIVTVLLSLWLAVPAFADGVDAFEKFSMGAMLGMGPSYMTGSDKNLYSDNYSAGFGIYFRMAFPVTSRASVLADIGLDGTFGFAGEYEYLRRTVVDSVETYGMEFTVMWNVFVAENVFVSAGPSFRIPQVDEKIEVDGTEVFSQEEVDYGNDLWLDAVVAFGYKNNGVELGLRTGYEFLGMYKETDSYRKVDIHELRFRLYFTYWFGQKRN